MKKSIPAVEITGNPVKPKRASFNQISKRLLEAVNAFENATPDLCDDPEIFAEKLRIQKQVLQDLIDTNTDLVSQQGSSVLHANIVKRMPENLFSQPLYQVIVLDRVGAGAGTVRILPAREDLGDAKEGETVKICNTPTGPLIIDREPNFVHYGEQAVVTRINPEMNFPICASIRSDEYSAREMFVKARFDLPRKLEVGDEILVENGFAFQILDPTNAGGLKDTYTPDLNLNRSMLVGEVAQAVVTHLVSAVHAFFDPKYLKSGTTNFGQYCMLMGVTGTGKTIALDCSMAEIHREFNQGGRERVKFARLSAAGIHSGIVGSAARRLLHLNEMAEKCYQRGQVLFIWIEEMDKLVLPRHRLASALDSGAGLEATSQLLQMTSGGRRIKAILAGDLNVVADQVDPAIRDRFTCFEFPQIDRSQLLEIFRRCYARERNLFEGEWSEFQDIIEQAYAIRIGEVLAGSEHVVVTVGDITSGRMSEQTLLRAINHCNIYTYLHRNNGGRNYRVTPTLLFNNLVRLAHTTFSRMAEDEARKRLADLVGRDKENSISRPRPLDWVDVAIPENMNLHLETLGLIDEAQSQA